MIRSIIIFLFLVLSLQAIAQQRQFQVMDIETSRPIPDAAVLYENRVVAKGDAFGNISLADSFKSRVLLVIVSPGYFPDTITRFKGIIYLQRLRSTLKEVVISSSKVKKVFRSPVEYIVDYDFKDSNILVCSYSGANGKKAKVFLINDDGDTLALRNAPRNPGKIYKTCAGEYHYATADSLYPVLFIEDKIRLEKPFAIDILENLQKCQFQIDSFFFFKLISRNNFSSGIYSLKTGDTAFKVLLKTEDMATAKASVEEYQKIQALLALGLYKEAAKMSMRRDLFDRSAIRNLEVAAFNVDGYIVAFNFFDRLIYQYSIDGTLIKKAPLLLNWTGLQKVEWLQDAATHKIYLHRFRNNVVQTIEEIDPGNGTSLNRIVIEKPLAEKVKVNNNNIYFLWQNSNNFSTMQLYKQRM